MKARVLLWVHGIAALLFGLAFLLIPAIMTDLLGVATDQMGEAGWRFFGLGILALGGMAFGFRDERIDEIRIPFVLVMFLFFVAMIILKFALVIFAGVAMNAWSWVLVVFFLIMAVWYGYYLNRRW